MVARKVEVELQSEDQGTESSVKDQASFWKIQSMDFLFMEVAIGLILYPGSYAYITGEQKSALPDYALSMIVLSEITEKEYRSKIGSQGLLGLG
jgi:hypothetical protein